MPSPLLHLLPVFNAQPGATLLLSAEWVIVGASDDYLAATLTDRATIVGQHIFEAFPDNPGTPEANAVANVRASLAQVMATREPHDMAPQHYDVPDRTRPGHFVERHWKPRHTPVLDTTGQVQFIIQSVQDITESRVAEQRLRESQAREQAARAETERHRAELQRVYEEAPVAMGLMRGPDFVLEWVNARMGQIWGRPLEQVIGRPHFEALPDLAGQGFEQIFADVLETGRTVSLQEMLVCIEKVHEPYAGYFNITYQPVYDGAQHITGILCSAFDVTEQVRARQQVEQLNQELETRVQQRTHEAETAHAEAVEQRNRLLRVFSQAPAQIDLFQGPDHIWTLVHPRTQELLPNRQLQGLPRRLALPELPPEQQEPFDRVYRTGQPVHVLETIRRINRFDDGELHDEYFDITFQPKFNAAGQIEGVMSFAINVSERVRASQQAEALQADLLAAARQQAQERAAFHNVFEQTPALIALLRDPGHRYEYVNPAYQALFPGRPLVGLLVAEAVPELLEQGFGPLLNKVYQTGETFFGTETPFTPRNASSQPAAATYYNFTYQAYREAGEIAGISIFAFNVTEQVLARQEREAQRQQLQSVFAQAPVAVCVFQGEDFVLDIVNPPMGEMLGRPLSALLGQPCFQVLPELRDQGVPEMLAGVHRTGTPFIAQEQEIYLAHHRPGQPGFYNFVYQPLHADDGPAGGIVCVAIDVTEQVRARQRVQELNDKLQATNAELSDSNRRLTRTNVDLDNFIYTASHDLKAPITNIEGLLQAIRHELPPLALVGDVPEMLSLMQQATERFQRTIEQLTDVSKLQQAHDQPATQVPLATLVEEVMLDLDPLVQQTRAGLTIDVPPAACLPFSEKNLRSIVYNLLSNAFKYHHPDRPPQVHLHYHRQDAHHVLVVQDNGLGLDLSQGTAKLFGLFQRLHAHVEGTGIGLYMVKRMVENGGGRIEVTSQPGIGTTFSIYFPVHPVA